MAAMAAAAMIAPFKPAAECDERDVIHLKGFAARLDFSDAATARQADALIEAVAAHKRSRPSLCVAWDGDAPSDESFTRLLRRCASLGCELIAFCYACYEADFRKAWGPEGLAIRGYIVEQPSDDVACRWAFLGVSALRATRATECLCLGGGPVALREFEASAAAFVLYEVSRRPRDGAGAPERSALLARASHERLRVVSTDEATGGGDEPAEVRADPHAHHRRDGGEHALGIVHVGEAPARRLRVPLAALGRPVPRLLRRARRALRQPLRHPHTEVLLTEEEAVEVR